MRIIVIATAASSGGALTVLESLFNHVTALPGTHEWVFLVSVSHLPSSQRVRVHVVDKRGWLTRLSYEAFRAKRSLYKEQPELVISLQNTLPRGIPCRQVLYLHQPVPFQTTRHFRFWKRAETRLAVYQHVISQLIFRSVRRADLTVVQTNWMRDAVLARGLSQPSRVVVIPPRASDLNLPVEPTNAEFDRRRFLYPTSPATYKNNETVLSACELLGTLGHEEFLTTLTLEGTSPHPCVELIGKVPHDEIITRLSTSTLVFASQIETFGLPLLEARSLGTVILAADCAYAREVLDGYEDAYFFDPEKPADLAALMEMVLTGRIARRTSEGMAVTPTGGSGWADVLRIAVGDPS